MDRVLVRQSPVVTYLCLELQNLPKEYHQVAVIMSDNTSVTVHV